jgi:hypothetical protein
MKSSVIEILKTTIKAINQSKHIKHQSDFHSQIPNGAAMRELCGRSKTRTFSMIEKVKRIDRCSLNI